MRVQRQMLDSPQIIRQKPAMHTPCNVRKKRCHQKLVNVPEGQSIIAPLDDRRCK